MTSSATSLPSGQPQRSPIGPAGLACALSIVLLFGWFHATFLWRTLLTALEDKDWSHALAIPVIGLYYIYANRQRLSAAPVPRLPASTWRVTAGFGLILTLTGVAGYLSAGYLPVAIGQLIRLAGPLVSTLGGVALALGLLGLHPLVIRSLWAPAARRLGLPTEAEPWLRVAGLLVLLLALLAYTWAMFPIQNAMARGYSMILALFGLCWFLFGPRMMGVLWFPIAYLLLAVKISDRVWDQIAYQLQDLAAAGATIALKFFAALMSFDVTSRGNTIELSFLQAGQWVTEPINVAEACAGLRMLMAFIALGTALAFLWDHRWWQRVVIVAATIPIALLVNIGRVTVTGLLFLYDPALARGDPHTFVGVLMLIPAAGLLVGVSWTLKKIVIPEPEAGPHPEAQVAPSRGRASENGSSDWRAFFAGHPPAGRSLLKTAGLGAVIGGGLTLLLGLAYLAGLAAVRPDVLGGYLPKPLPVAVLTLALAGLAGGLLLLARRLTGQGPTSLVRSALVGGVAAAVLLVAAGGQQTVLATTRTVLLKEPVPLRRPLALVPDELATWQAGGDDIVLPDAQVEALGTRRYLVRRYEASDRQSAVTGRAARVHVAYYTGQTDTVPHVPDRCFVAGGLRPMGTERTELTFPREVYAPAAEAGRFEARSKLKRGQTGKATVTVPGGAIPATIFTYAPSETAGQAEPSNVVYFFLANGRFMATPEDVRIEGWDPRDKRGYYCKIELALPGVADQARARQRASDLLAELLPEILACLPDLRKTENAGAEPATGFSGARRPSQGN